MLCLLCLIDQNWQQFTSMLTFRYLTQIALILRRRKTISTNIFPHFFVPNNWLFHLSFPLLLRSMIKRWNLFLNLLLFLLLFCITLLITRWWYSLLFSLFLWLFLIFLFLIHLLELLYQIFPLLLLLLFLILLLSLLTQLFLLLLWT